MADQCIVCLEALDTIPTESDSPLSNHGTEAAEVAPTALGNDFSDATSYNSQPIAIIKTCGHILHDTCLQAWIEKANSCPICRQAFHLVEVYDKVGGKPIDCEIMHRFSDGAQTLTNVSGNLLNTYTVEDKKQVAEFDPSAWIDDQVEQFESTPCPICDSADNEEVLLLCDACDAPYHTHCVGLDDVPHGHWFCMECIHEGANSRSADLTRLQRPGRQPRTFTHRTQAQVRRARRRVPTDAWYGAWNQISGRVYDALNLELDFSDDEQSMAGYRRHANRTASEQREFQQWQQRVRIASRQGARDVFRAAARPMIQVEEQPEMQKPNPEEEKAWEAFEQVRESDLGRSSSRKRKARSITKSPAERSAEPERKLKRPKTRRVVNKPGSPSGEASTSRRNTSIPASLSPRRHAAPVTAPTAAPSFLSSLLKEVEMSASTDDESAYHVLGNDATSPSIEHSSPAASPSASNYSTPRALSPTTPPPYRHRPSSPLPLTSRVEPIYPPANYSPNRSPPQLSHKPDGERLTLGSPPEIRQPRPRRQQRPLPRSHESSPSRANLSIEAKEGINKIVRTALEPHYKKPSGITKEQYSAINRLVSRMLYEKISDPNALDDNTKSAWEKIASAEVTKAVEGLSA